MCSGAGVAVSGGQRWGGGGGGGGGPAHRHLHLHLHQQGSQTQTREYGFYFFYFSWNGWHKFIQFTVCLSLFCLVKNFFVRIFAVSFSYFSEFCIIRTFWQFTSSLTPCLWPGVGSRWCCHVHRRVPGEQVGEHRRVRLPRGRGGRQAGTTPTA